MSTFANHDKNSISAQMSESDNDDDIEQNSSFNQQHEGMMHKVKDVVSKLLHPSFLFSTSVDTNRIKRKRTISVEDNGNEKQAEITVTTTATTNGHPKISKLSYHRQSLTANESQLTDDEDNNRDVSLTETNVTEIEQQKKRRRTANYQHIISTTTTNGSHEDERTSLPFISKNSVESSSNRRTIDNELTKTDTTPVLLQRSTEKRHNEEINRLTSSKQRFNIPSTSRGLTSSYDPSQSPLFSVGLRKTTETTMSPDRTTTNLKSNRNEFSANYLLATGLANQSRSTSQSTQQSSSLSTNRLLSNERQMFGVNYSSINSRRLPYIERLRRRTLQDCIRLNRTLDSEPLSISTIEEHRSTTASPIRKPIKASEKECGIQCNISTKDATMEPTKKFQRTFPPADIRNEALSVPTNEKAQLTSQTDSSIQTNSSITIKPIHDLRKPKVLGNITPFSWPKFIRAQEDYAKKYPEKCRNDAVSSVPSKSIDSSIIEKSNVNIISSKDPQTSISSTISKIPIFDVSPPRSSKPVAESTWKCPSCTIEHPAQTASCSFCHRINPNYKRLSVIETTSKPSSSKTLPDVNIQKSTVPTSVTTSQTMIQSNATPIVTSVSSITTINESTFSVPSTVTTNALFSTANTLPSFGTVTTTTHENTITNPSVITTPIPSTMTTPSFGTTTASASFGITTTTTSPSFGITTTTTASPSFGITTTATSPSFGITTTASSSFVTTTTTSSFSFGTTTASTSFGTTTTASSDKPATTTMNNLFQISTNTTSTFPLFSSSTGTTMTGSASTLPSLVTTTTSSSTSSTFGHFSMPTTTTTGTASSTISTEKSSLFSVGIGAPNLSLASSTATIPNLFAFSSNITAPTTTVPTLAPPFSVTTTTTSGSLFPSVIPPVSTSPMLTTSNMGIMSSASLFGTGLSTSSSGFSFPSAGTTTSSSTPFAFGASSPPKPFAPLVVSSSNTTTTPAFGATASFGAASTIMDKSPMAIPPFSSFGSNLNQSSTFNFGGTPNPAANANQATGLPSGASSGFSFGTPSTAAGVSTLGSSGPAFAFGGAPSFSFGAGSAAPGNNAPFQFSASPSTGNNNPSFNPVTGTSDNNPFSVPADDSSNKRTVIKAKRRAKP